MEYYSTDNGNTWQAITSPVQLGTKLQSVPGEFFCLGDSLLRSSDGIEWQYAAEGLSSANISDVVAYSGNVFAIVSLNTVSRSTDGGETWSIIPNFSASHFTILPSGLYANNQYHGGLRRWNDSVWVTLIDTPNSIFCVAEQGDTLFAASSLNQLYGNRSGDSLSQYLYSTDNGQTWIPGVMSDLLFEDISLPNGSDVEGWATTILNFYDNGTSLMAVDAVQDFIVTDSGQGHQESYEDDPVVLLSTDAGRTWTGTDKLVPSMNGPVSIVHVDSVVFEGLPSGLWAINDSDNDFLDAPKVSGINDVVFLDSADNGVIAGGKDTSIGAANLYFVTRNRSVTELVSGDTLTSITGYTTDSTYAYIGTSGRGIWRTPLTSLPLQVSQSSTTSSTILSVYPNPSTSQAIISFSLLESGYISVAVYDELGIERSKLFDGEMGAGNHEIPFANTYLPNGIYEVVLSTAINRSIGRLVIDR
jgi:hypothetical protein